MASLLQPLFTKKAERDTTDRPVATSPKESPPLSREKLDTADAQPRIASPLRSEHKSDSYSSPNGKATSPPGLGIDNSPVLSENAQEFPFSLPPGAAGLSPTNQLAQATVTEPGITREEEDDQATELHSSAVGNLTRKNTQELGTMTPQGRRSVQFARSDTAAADQSTKDVTNHSRQQSQAANGEQTPEGAGKETLGSQLMSKLRALTSPIVTPGHNRTQSGWSIRDPNTEERISEQTPSHDGPDRLGDYEADAEADESAAENALPGPLRAKKRRRFRRDTDEGSLTAPTTPRARMLHTRDDSMDQTPPPSASQPRPNFLPRRATMSDIPENQRLAMSEDEGRDRLAADGLWRRGSAWVSGHRGSTTAVARQQHRSDETHDARRPTGIRRLTQFGHSADGSPSPWRMRNERGTSMSGQRWRQIKASLKMLGARKREENRIEAAKSAELMAELLAGAPAALFLASMFQRDEKGHKRVPILLEQLRVNVTDSQKDSKEKHSVFRVELEYGSSLARMKWVIQRDIENFWKLHVNYKAEEVSHRARHPTRRNERSKLPKFPKSVFPVLGDYFSSMALKEDDSDEDKGEHTAEEQSGVDGEASGTDRPGKPKKRRSSFQLLRKKSSRLGNINEDGTDQQIAGLSGRRVETVQDRQRRKLEEYLNKMVTYVMFRANSNRLCRFLEVSALGVRLASEGYHGKEGPLSIRSTRGVDYRKPSIPRLLGKFRPASSKWFLVRDSYLVCVDSIEEMNVYDVILVDPDFSVERKRMTRKRDDSAKELAQRAKDTARHPTNHQLKINNTERVWKLTAENERMAIQFEESVKFVQSQSAWARQHRYDSFAPVRQNVWAQFLVDGRDYMWNVSRAISMARDVIYIHDWWLSPQLYMRRPAAISQRWRLDRLLQRKAEEGVKIYVIMYRNINSAIPIDSEFSKHSLLFLNPEGKNNVFVQRSPNQLRQNTFFWAHHEKICVIDHCVAFLGGVDLCFGRWDLPSHPVVDDKPTGFEGGEMSRNADNCQLWPGKDYSNPRVQDFFNLDKPYEEMYNREKVPRMPWHDIGMQVVGQAARDLSRHFVQRWNFLLRQRTPSRPTPFLLPPTDFLDADLEALGLEGTCEVQILRSACSWSLGTPNRIECSIMNAYVDMIKNSEHFVYIENQFFISTCEIMGTKVENGIGDALVQRIIRAHEEDTYWRAIILIPLMPGFQNAVDAQDGSSVRIIMECQYRSICRGSTSIFARLRAHGIEPEDYIEFYALRSHGKIGPEKALVTEQLYIHAKVMVVDDRIAIIGSANINERSMLGSRDSETAAIVRDSDMFMSKMAGEDYAVGKFAHGLRMRLMREHLGIDVDAIHDEELEDAQVEFEMDGVNGNAKARAHSHGLDSDVESVASAESDRAVEQRLINNKLRFQEDVIAKQEQLHSFNHDVDWTQANNPHIKPAKKRTRDVRVENNQDFKSDLLGLGTDKMLDHEINYKDHDARDTKILNNHEVMVSDLATEGRGTAASPEENRRQLLARRKAQALERMEPGLPPPPPLIHRHTTELGLPQLSQLPALPIEDDTDIGGPPLQRSLSSLSQGVVNPMLEEMRRPLITPDCMQDPVVDSFFADVWQAVAENNTKIFRSVFRCQPDNEVRSWQQYKEYAAFSERFAHSQGLGSGGKTRQQQESKGRSGPPGTALSPPTSMESAAEKFGVSRHSNSKEQHLTADAPEGHVQDWAQEQEQRVNEKTIDHSAEGVDTRDFDALAFNEKHSEDPSNAEQVGRQRTVTISEPKKSKGIDGEKNVPPIAKTSSVSTGHGSQRRRRRGTGRSSHRPFHADDTDALLAKKDAEELLKLVQGHLVVFPYDWLSEADDRGQFIYSVDLLAPLEIYN